MFHVGYGSKNREENIRLILVDDHTTALILASVHFEWMIKRAILKLSRSPTKSLREELAMVYSLKRKDNKDYCTVWNEQVASRFKNAKLGKILGKLTTIQSEALDARGKVIHGNGTVSRKDAENAVELFLEAGVKLRNFAIKCGEDLDSRLSARRNPK